MQLCGCEFVAHELEGNLLRELPVGARRQVDAPHAALAEHAQQPVRADVRVQHAFAAIGLQQAEQHLGVAGKHVRAAPALRQQLRNLRAHAGFVGGVLREPGVALRIRSFEALRKQFLDAAPAVVVVHGAGSPRMFCCNQARASSQSWNTVRW